MNGKEAFCKTIDVSRETLARLEIYDETLRKWNAAINLVSPQTLDSLWTRHFLDSAQIFALASPRCKIWADLGSGGGFPGLVVAILAAERRPDIRVTLVESDGRKAAFLATTANAMGLPVAVNAGRIENLPPLRADVISARALAPLSDLLGFAERHLASGGRALFLKGARWREELTEAEKHWRFICTPHQSTTDPKAVILDIEGAQRV